MELNRTPSVSEVVETLSVAPVFRFMASGADFSFILIPDSTRTIITPYGEWRLLKHHTNKQCSRAIEHSIIIVASVVVRWVDVKKCIVVKRKKFHRRTKRSVDE